MLEVLVALAVVAFALTALVKSSGETTGNSAYLRDKTYAHWIAMNRMEELRVEGKWLRVGTQSDEVEMFGTEWRWIQTVSQSPNEYTKDSMRIVKISVLLAEKGDDDFPLVTLTGFLTHPKLLASSSDTSN